MNDSMKTALIEAVNYVIREYFFGVLTGLSSLALIALAGINIQTGEINVDWPFLLGLAKAILMFNTLQFLIGAIDKFKHIFTKEESPKETEGLTMGIVPSALQIETK